MRRIVGAAIVLVTILTPLQQASASSQREQHLKVTVFSFYDSWKEEAVDGDEKVREAVLGVTINRMIGPRFELDLFGTISSASYSDRLGSDAGLSAVNDTRLKGTYFFGDKMASASLFLNIPTGKSKLSDDQYSVARQVSDNSRRFIVRRFGQGLDIGGDVFLLPNYESADFKIGVGFLRKGGYHILAIDPLKYKYGNELFGTVDASVESEPFRFNGSLTLKTYGKDEYGSESVYQAGNTLVLSGQAAYVSRLRGRLGFTVVNRGRSKVSDDNGGNLSDESLKSGRNEFSTFVSVSAPIDERLRLIGRGEYKSISANEYGSSSSRFRPGARYIGLGAGLSNQFSPAVAGSFMATYRDGSVNSVNDLSGIGLAAALTITYW